MLVFIDYIYEVLFVERKCKRPQILCPLLGILVSVAEIGVLPIRPIAPIRLQTSTNVIVRLAVLLVSFLVFYAAEHIIGQTGSCHEAKCAKHHADTKNVCGSLSVEEELGADDISNSCRTNH